MNFFKSFLASCLGTVVALAVLVFFVVIWIIALSGDKEVAVAENSVLHLKLEAPISELEVEDPIAEIFPGAAKQSFGLLQLLETIRHAKSDEKIKGIYLNTSGLST